MQTQSQHFWIAVWKNNMEHLWIFCPCVFSQKYLILIERILDHISCTVTLIFDNFKSKKLLVWLKFAEFLTFLGGKQKKATLLVQVFKTYCRD